MLPPQKFLLVPSFGSTEFKSLSLHPQKGISGKLTKRGVCFCISTAYEGTYLHSYYLDVLTKPEVQIQRHSVPTFIPLEQIARRHLQTDIRRFLAVLSDHLNAYAGRRYQADQLQVPGGCSSAAHFSFCLFCTKYYKSVPL